MEIQEFWNFLKATFSPLDFVAVGFVYFLTNQYKELLPKGVRRRLVPLVVAAVVTTALLVAAPAEGPFAGHIQAPEVPIYTLAYTALALGLRTFLKRFEKSQGE